MRPRAEKKIPVAPHPALGTPAKGGYSPSPEKSGVGCYHTRLLLSISVGNLLRFRKKKKRVRISLIKKECLENINIQMHCSARHCSKQQIVIIFLSLLEEYLSYPHFTDEKAVTQ